MNSHQLEELIKNIQMMIKCPSCGSSYKKENINFLGQMGQAVLVQLNCYICKMPVMATIVIQASGKLPSFKDVEELSKNLPSSFSLNKKKEKDNITRDKPVTSDEILELHEFLEDFDGNFKSLFNK